MKRFQALGPISDDILKIVVNWKRKLAEEAAEYNKPKRRRFEYEPGGKLLIRNIDVDTTNGMIRGHFKEYGIVLRVFIKPLEDKGYIIFEKRHEADRAMADIHTICGNLITLVRAPFTPDSYETLDLNQDDDVPEYFTQPPLPTYTHIPPPNINIPSPPMPPLTSEVRMGVIGNVPLC